MPFFAVLFLLLVSCSHTLEKESYPKHWWKPVPKEQLKSWEVGPSRVEPPQVILSKRNELGLLSNFAATSFNLDGQTYASVEGFWQSLKYPENKDDRRFKMAKWPHTRKEVSQMTAFKAKKAGQFASQVMKKNKVDWVSYQNERMIYREDKKGAFYKLIRRAMLAKLNQNPRVHKVLVKTKGLALLPDHSQGSNPPPAWQYHKIWMELRETLN